MQLQLIRKYRKAEYTLGVLYLNGKEFCHTLEPSATALHPCIPEGEYKVQMYPSRKFGMVPIILNVPHRSGILIHAGNTARDTKGCILVGHLSPANPRPTPASWPFPQGEGVIVNSRKTLALLITEITAAEQRGEPVVLQVV